MANLITPIILSVFVCAVITLCNASCGQIFENKVNAAEQSEAVKAHNTYRKMIYQGKVPNQPKSRNFVALEWDAKLAAEAQEIANTCEFEHVTVKDGRFPVGQNLYWSASTAKQLGADWSQCVKEWYDENEDFIYPATSRGVTGHYTQVVWENTKLVGCGYTMYQQSDSEWFEKLYVCNYGPGGNYVGEAPYEV